MTTLELERFKAATVLTLSTGEITPVLGVHFVAAETGVTDDLDTINGGVNNNDLKLMPDTGDTITIKHNTGNIKTGDGNDIELSGDKVAHLIYDTANSIYKVVAVSATGGGGGTTTLDVATGTPVVWEYEVSGAAEQTIDVPANVLNHERLQIFIDGINDAGSDVSYSLYINDSGGTIDNTANNYFYQLISSVNGNNLSGAENDGALIAVVDAAGDDAHVVVDLSCKQSMIALSTEGKRNTSGMGLETRQYVIEYEQTLPDTITLIRFYSSLASGFGVGTKIVIIDPLAKQLQNAVVDSQTASNSASLEFNVSTFGSQVKFLLDNIVPATDGADLLIEVSDDGGSTWEGANYKWANGYEDSSNNPAAYDGDSSTASGNTDAIYLTGSVGSDTGEGLSGEINMDDPGSTIYKNLRYEIGYIDTSGNSIKATGAGAWQGSTDDITHVRIRFDSGNIESGTIKMIDPTAARSGDPNVMGFDERLVPGKYWEDPDNLGDFYPVYRKLIDVGSLPDSTTKDVTHGITNAHFDSLMVTDGVYTDGTNAFSPNRPDPGSNSSAISTWPLASAVRIKTGNDRTSYSGWVALEFAKTTDTALTYAQAYGNGAGGASLSRPQTFTAGQRMQETTLTDGANISWDLNDSNNFKVTLGGNRQLDNPSNIASAVGQSGRITIVQDGTGSRTLSYDTYWKFAGGVAPTLTTTAGATDVLCYEVLSSSEIMGQLVADVK